MSDAEALTGIKNQQVSKWARRLQDREKYRAALFETAYNKAMAAAGIDASAEVIASKWTGDPEGYTPCYTLASAH